MNLLGGEHFLEVASRLVADRVSSKVERGRLFECKVGIVELSRSFAVSRKVL